MIVHFPISSVVSEMEGGYDILLILYSDNTCEIFHQFSSNLERDFTNKLHKNQ